MKFKHIPVMLNEVIEGLNIKPNGIYVDGTIGGAGHSREIIQKLSKEGQLVGIDRDEEALETSKGVLKDFNNVIYLHGNHDEIKKMLTKSGIKEVDGILLDLGVSSYQLDEKERGFTYIADSRLDMRMDKSQEISARYIINEYSEKDLAKIIYEYGEEKFSRTIAKNICKVRNIRPIETTMELTEIVKKSIPFKGEMHPEKRTFQAIRIEVNNELKPLYNTIKESIDMLKNNGRLCVITFHSLEDREVKKAFNDSIGKCTCPKDLPYCICNNKKQGKIITAKPILPSKEEIANNSRSSSAKLRIFEKEV